MNTSNCSLAVSPPFRLLNGLLFLLKVFGRILAILPEFVVSLICRILGFIVLIVMPQRRKKTLRSLHHAYPEKSEAWRRSVLRTSAARLFEMGLFRPASAFFSRKRLEQALVISPDAEKVIREYAAGGNKHGRPVVILLAHCTMTEAATMMPSRFPELPPVHVIFRPLNQASVNRWVTGERERFGAKMLSRNSGYNDAMAALRRGEMVGVLFDQNASKKGTTITFMDRIVSASDLPGLLAHRFQADTYVVYLERTGFWKSKLSLQQIPLGESPTEVTIRAHDALEAYLRRDANTAADWLWLHDRWRRNSGPHKRFRLPARRNQLDLSNRIHGYDTLPRKIRLWVRLPNWLGDVAMLLPILRAMRTGRPDLEFTLIGKAAFEPLANRLGVADRFVALPTRGSGYFRAFYAMRKQYPDSYILFTNSFRGDMEAFLTRCPQRYGMIRPGKWRPLLTTPYRLPKKIDETQVHQTEIWKRMAHFYGLEAPLDYSPVVVDGIERIPNRVGLICGTENSPEKRWPISHWRTLVEGLIAKNPQVDIALYGTPADRTITDAVCDGFTSGNVRNLAGQTNLAEFCDELSACSVVCCNDTGGMHLANMLGTQVVAVFGPTNPVRTGPVFSTPHTILQPEGCPATGGMPIDQVSPERCLHAINQALAANS